MISRLKQPKLPDQKVATELAESGRSQSDAPRRGERDGSTADQRLLQDPALVEDRHRSLSGGGLRLRSMTRRRVGHIHTSADVIDVEGDESLRADRSRGCKSAGAELTGTKELLYTLIPPAPALLAA